MADPAPGAPSGRLTSIGEARSRGLELDLVGDISDNWTLTFSYGFNDTVILEGADALGNSVSDKFANAPAHQLGFWTRYDFPAIGSAIAFGGGMSRRHSASAVKRRRPLRSLTHAGSPNGAISNFRSMPAIYSTRSMRKAAFSPAPDTFRANP